MATDRDNAVNRVWSNQTNRLNMMRKILSKAKLQPNGCVEWQGYRNSNGYGTFGFFRIQFLAHRMSWGFANGRPADKNKFICHTCDNPSCINPEHLFEGDPVDNVRDMIVKKRGRVFGYNRESAIGKHTQSKLTVEQVKLIDDMYKEGKTCEELAPIFKVHRRTIYDVAHGKTWSHITGRENTYVDLRKRK